VGHRKTSRTAIISCASTQASRRSAQATFRIAQGPVAKVIMAPLTADGNFIGASAFSPVTKCLQCPERRAPVEQRDRDRRPNIRSPVIDGHLYVGSWDHKLYAFGV